MSKVKKFLSNLEENKQIWFDKNFGSMDKFYATIYLIIKNEHLTELNKPDKYEERLNTILQVKNKIENVLNCVGLDGKEIVADIASDYFEDYVNYKEPYAPLTNEEFLSNIRNIINM